MSEGFSIILGIPPAIESILNLIDRLRAGGRLQSETLEELSHLRGMTDQVKQQLHDFAVAFDELEAWKWVHDITNLVFADLDETFRAVNGSGDAQVFADETFSDKSSRKRILSELRSMSNVNQTLPKLGVYRANTRLRAVIGDLHETNEDRLPWCELVTALIDKAKMEINDRHPKETFNALDHLYRYCSDLNSRANEAIRKGVTRFGKVMDDLRRATSAT